MLAWRRRLLKLGTEEMPSVHPSASPSTRSTPQFIHRVVWLPIRHAGAKVEPAINAVSLGSFLNYKTRLEAPVGFDLEYPSSWVVKSVWSTVRRVADHESFPRLLLKLFGVSFVVHECPGTDGSQT